MNYADLSVVIQEVPGEVSICFTITGCPLQCKGCHSPYLWKQQNGAPLHPHVYKEVLKKYDGLATCVLFMGGEWHEEALACYLQQAQQQGYKTCLYTGQEQVPKKLLSHLTWVKTGAWNAQLGGLSSPTTNQQFIEVASKQKQNHLFLKS